MPYLSGFNPSGGAFFCIFRFLAIILKIDVFDLPSQMLTDLALASVNRGDATPHALHIVLTPRQRPSRTLPFKVILAVCQLPDECHLQRDARLLLPVRLVGVFKESHQPSDEKSPTHPTIKFVI